MLLYTRYILYYNTVLHNGFLGADGYTVGEGDFSAIELG